MRKICLSFILTFFYVFVFAQSYIDVKRDSLTLKGEVIINNATKNIQGYLYNTGNGVTKFVEISTNGVIKDSIGNGIFYVAKKYSGTSTVSS